MAPRIMIQAWEQIHLASNPNSAIYQDLPSWSLSFPICMLTPWKEIMTNLDSISKSRDITLPTKVRLAKAMVFPVVMCGFESCTVKKAEH